MENRIVRKAIETETVLLAEIIKANPGCYLEVNTRDSDKWTLYSKKPDFEIAPEGVNECKAYLENLTLADSSEFDFPGVSGVNDIDPVLYEAMAIALGITIAPEE